MSRVLVVDDDHAVLAAIDIMLRRCGHTAVLVENAGAAVKAIEAQHFDLLMVDVFMPEMDGFELIRLARQRMPELPIVAMSGSSYGKDIPSPPDFLGMATKLGAVARLRKPFGPAELSDAITYCIGCQPSPAGAGPASRGDPK